VLLDGLDRSGSAAVAGNELEVRLGDEWLSYEFTRVLELGVTRLLSPHGREVYRPGWKRGERSLPLAHRGLIATPGVYPEKFPPQITRAGGPVESAPDGHH